MHCTNADVVQPAHSLLCPDAFFLPPDSRSSTAPSWPTTAGEQSISQAPSASGSAYAAHC